MFDPNKIYDQLQWLKEHPWFSEKPASIEEFLGPEYLNIESGIRPGVKAELIELFGEEVNPHRIAKYLYGMFTGAIGIGKTTMASIVLPYMAHWCYCLKNPQEYFGLLPGSRIAFMMMSTSEDQARETLFGDIKARIDHSPWFQNNAPRDPKFTNQIRFDKDLWILPGGSEETQFEGYNILGGILDEADSHKQTRDKDYAEQGFSTIDSRVTSRFEDKGFLLVIGQMKKAAGFVASKYADFQEDPRAHTVRMTIWESRGWEHYRNKETGRIETFWYDVKRKCIITKEAAELIAHETAKDRLMEIPMAYYKQFKNAPEKALRDLAGIPPQSSDPFIGMTTKIDDCVERWNERYGSPGSPITSSQNEPTFAEWFRALDSRRRAVHLDIAYSAKGDAAGIVMGHVAELVKIEDELKPHIVIDCMIRVLARPGQEIVLSTLRRYIYNLVDDLHFKINVVTMDGFQSTDTRQQLKKRRIKAQYLSMDRSKLPFEDMRDAIYEERLDLPPYMTYLKNGDDTLVMIANKELAELTDTGRKIDHPLHGSKDVADGIAGVVHTLMGDRTYRKGVISTSDASDSQGMTDSSSMWETQFDHSSERPRRDGLRAPVPPKITGGLLDIPAAPAWTNPRRTR